MKKSSLGRRSSAASSSRKTLDFVDKGSRSGIPMPMNCVPSRKRDLSNDRMTDFGSVSTTPSTGGTLRTPRPLTMSTGRASSIGGSKKIDNRPLLDREWQIIAIESIQNVLAMDQEGCGVLESSRNLKPMTLMNFITIANYFVRKLDPSLEVNKANYLTELVFILKKLSYKGKVDKAMLQTVNTMHNWPHALGILQFLASLVEVSEDFKKLGLDPLYPATLEPESQSEDSLNFKLVVPFLRSLWDQVGHEECWDPKTLISSQYNLNRVNEVLAVSGFSEEVFLQENESVLKLEEANNEHQETMEKLHKLEEQYKAVIERRRNIEAKGEMLRSDVDALKGKHQQELNKQTEIEKETAHIDDQCKFKQDIVNCYKQEDEKQPSLEEYESYKKKKESLLEAMRYERDIAYRLGEGLTDEKIKFSELKFQCEELFKEYNKVISELIREDVSLRGAVCHTRPRMGTTPCNEATAQLLKRTLASYQQSIAQLESDLNADDLSDQFKESEELKTKIAILNQLDLRRSDIIAQFEQTILELQKEEGMVDKENEEINEEIHATEEELKKNQAEFEEMELEIKKREEKMNKYQTICQRKLELRYQSIVELDRKTKGMLDKVVKQAKNVITKLEK